MSPDIGSIIIGVIITLVIETLLFYFLGPSIRFLIIFWLNQKSKSLRDIPIEIEFRRYSSSINDEIQLNEVKDPLISRLGEMGISSADQGVDISIHAFNYASTPLNGSILFAFSDFKKELISQIVLHFNKTCHFKTLSDDVFGLVNGVKSFEDSIRFTLPQGVVFRDEIKCNLKNLENMTGILKKFTDISTENPFQYLYIKDTLNIEISSNDVILREDIDSKSIQLLKSLITMYY